MHQQCTAVVSQWQGVCSVQWVRSVQRARSGSGVRAFMWLEPIDSAVMRSLRFDGRSHLEHEENTRPKTQFSFLVHGGT